jgi:hypothetical protein
MHINAQNISNNDHSNSKNTSTSSSPTTISTHNSTLASNFEEEAQHDHSERGQDDIITLPHITVATQNCSGMRGEFEKGQGPKIAMLRALITNQDFVVLTETRASRKTMLKLRLKQGLKATHVSLDNQPRAGVIIYSKDKHTLIPDSTREGTEKGHIAAAV